MTAGEDNGVNGVSQKHAPTTKVIGIRRETINVWERRAPLSPDHVKQLVSKGIKVLVQPMNRRVHAMWEYVQAGAEESEDLSEADLILSVKQVEANELLPNKTFAFFSHTIKAQKDNMPLLDKVLEQNVQLIDYEMMTNDSGRRVVMFGKWAGHVGAINILHGMGLRLLALGFNTPFMNIALAHNYLDMEAAKKSLNQVGKQIEQGDIPPAMGPLIFVVTGTGNVSQVRSATCFIKLCNCRTAQTLTRDDHLRRIDGKYSEKFNVADYEAHSDQYESAFAKEIAPYASVIINGILWHPSQPRLLKTDDAVKLLTPKISVQRVVPGQEKLPHRLIAICDISADPEGSIEFVRKCTTVDKPFYIYDQKHVETDSFDQKSGVLICSIDNMPCQMAKEATRHFGQLLLPYVYQMLKCQPDESFEEQKGMSDTIKRAIIAQNGRLTPKYEYIAALRAAQRAK
uniref:Saccharopine dehydrogenase (NAD(+), L-lysine-forming) n=1 Tax=Plectus sambesii TaxID=2011161 RepID=A0A914WJ94_9BILA